MSFSRVLVALAVGILLGTACGYRIAPVPFTGADGIYRFSHQAMLRDCLGMDPALKGTRGYPYCTSCDHPESGWKITECFEYQDGQFQSGFRSYFGGFLVQQPQGDLDTKACLSAQPEEEKQTKNRTIHAVTFTVFRARKSPEGRGEQWDIYRTYHNGQCYALIIRSGWTASTTPDNSNVNVKSKDQFDPEFYKYLKEPVDTFEFLK